MAKANWFFIGAGNMAGSLVGGLVGSGVSPADITIVDINEQAIDNLKQLFGVNSVASIEHIDEGASVVVSVKPHVVETVCKAMAVNKPELIISVAAGVRSDAISRWLPEHTAIVRCMPNTPALLGLGATALFANADCTESHRNRAQSLLSTAGKTCWVGKEDQLDAITALSGSGPAYFFYLIEHMANAAEALGLDASISREFAIETAFGAASMARTQQQSPTVLRENVTSKGGTTAAALSKFDELGLSHIIHEAMQAAQQRAIELGDEFGASSD